MSEQDRDQRTEAPTQQRLRKAKEEGQVGLSAELIGASVLLVGTLYFWFAGEWFFLKISNVIRFRTTYFEDAIIEPETTIGHYLKSGIADFGMATLALLVPVFVVAAISGLLQTQFSFSSKPLSPKPEKLDIVKGFKRIFSLKSLMRGFQAIAKTTVIVFVIYLISYSNFGDIQTAGAHTTLHFLMTMSRILLVVALGVAATILFLGVIDLAFQKWNHLQDMKMSQQDIRDEHKESEGDPLVRARVRKLQAEMSTRRMLDDVPKANVVVTNPTHFAVALEYDRKTMDAPKVTAKGGDHLARRIIEIAKQNGVPVVERKPVARYLYFNVEIGSQIPLELYQAMAEILNYVSRFKRSA